MKFTLMLQDSIDHPTDRYSDRKERVDKGRRANLEVRSEAAGR